MHKEQSQIELRNSEFHIYNLNMIKMMQSTILLFLCLSLPFIAISCVSTEAYTVSQNDIAQIATEYKVFGVWCDLKNRSMAKKLEYACIKELENYGLSGFSWIELFPPIREYENREYFAAILENEIDVMIYIDLQDSGTTSSVYSNDYGVHTSIHGYAMFEFQFQPNGFDDPILVTQITADGDDTADWEDINAAAARRAVKEYAKIVGIERLPRDPPKKRE